jgi:hypothetical protein
MRQYFFATILLSAGMIESVSGAALDCGLASQNWANGSRTTCPYDSNGGLIPAPTQVVPVEIPVVVPVLIPYDCAALTQDFLPHALRKNTVTDFKTAQALEEFSSDCVK